MSRLLGGVVVLVVYASVLRPGGESDQIDASAASAQEWLTASRDAYEAAQYEDALQPTIELTRAFPNQQVYAERLAQIYRHLDRPADEAAAWEQVVAVSPTPVDACPAMPDAYVRAAGLTEQAIDAFARCAAFEPENTDMLFYLGRAQEQAGHPDLAEKSFREAVRIEGTNGDSQLGLARLALRAGRVEAAKRAAVAVLTMYPNHADALLLAGQGAQRLGQAAEARRYLERALAVSETYADVHIALGVLDFSEGNIAAARGHFLRVVELQPNRRAEVAVWLERTKAGG